MVKLRILNPWRQTPMQSKYHLSSLSLYTLFRQGCFEFGRLNWKYSNRGEIHSVMFDENHYESVSQWGMGISSSRAFRQSVSQSVSQLIGTLVGQSILHSVRQAVSNSVGWSVSKSGYQVLSRTLMSWSASQTAIESGRQLVSQVSRPSVS